MIRTRMMHIAIVLLFCSPVFASAEPTVFGKQPSLKKVVSLGDLKAQYASYQDKDVLVEGKVEKVCVKKGCWMMVKNGNESMRVLFKDYGFFVPASLLNKSVKLQGKVVHKDVSQGTARHFAKDEGKSSKEIEKIKGSRKVYQFIATGVQIQG